MYVNNIEPEMFLPPGSESFNHNATRTTSSRSRSNNVNNNIVPVYRDKVYLITFRSIALKINRCCVISLAQYTKYESYGPCGFVGYDDGVLKVVLNLFLLSHTYLFIMFSGTQNVNLEKWQIPLINSDKNLRFFTGKIDDNCVDSVENERTCLL